MCASQNTFHTYIQLHGLSRKYVPCFLIYVVYDHGKKKIAIFWQIYMFSVPINIKKWFLECYLYVHVPSYSLNDWTQFNQIQYLKGYRSASSEHERSGSKNRGPSQSPFPQNWFYQKLL
jgi:hypothetical protein